MAKSPTLEELNDGRFEMEPKKWTPNSRHLFINMFFNLMGEKKPRAKKGGGLPSIDASTLENMSTPIAAQLIEFRQISKTLTSVKGALQYIFPEGHFVPSHTSPTGQKALIAYNTMGFDSIERIYTVEKKSLPLNVDKKVRNAFVSTEPSIPVGELSPEVLSLIHPSELED